MLMVYLPTFTGTFHVGKYTIHGWYGIYKYVSFDIACLVLVESNQSDLSNQ